MSNSENDFNTYKYNLYEILNIQPNADDAKIKKSYIKLIKNFHPDKNSELEQDIFQHIIYANMVLLNKNLRKKYDTYLADKSDTFNELKSSFNNFDVAPVSNTSAANNLFTNKIDELNKKHGYTSSIEIGNTMERYNKIKNNRDITINMDVKNTTELNNKFLEKSKDQLVEYKGTPAELSTYVLGEQYTNIADLDKLYIEDSVQCPKFSSLDRAFAIHNITVNSNSMNKSANDRIKEYKLQTEEYKNMKTSDFSNNKYSEI